MSTIAKKPNAAWKQYKKEGGTIKTFSEWLHREKEKMFYANGEDDSLLLVNQTLNDSVQNAIRDTLNKGGLKEQESNKTVLGINKKILIGSGIALMLAIIGFFAIKK